MILYYIPGACSLANHIALLEAEVPHKLVRVGSDKRTQDGRDFLAINPKGYVPALELDDGTIVTENLAVMAYIAHHSGKLLPPHDGITRIRALEVLSFLTTEIHNDFKPFFDESATEAEREKSRHRLERHLGAITQLLGTHSFLLGTDTMTIADPYLFVMLLWAEKREISISATLRFYLERMRGIPSVVQAMEAEGLV